MMRLCLGFLFTLLTWLQGLNLQSLARMREIAAISAMWALFKLKRRRGDRMQEPGGGPLNGNAQAA
jgi:hypothetical protein